MILDAGHGGTTDPGAVYQGRQEKNDNLRMALAVGQILSEDGVDVGYTRVQDVYQSPLQKHRWRITGRQIILFLSTGMPCRFRELPPAQKA